MSQKTPVHVAVIDLARRRVKLLEADGGFGGYATALFMAGDLSRSRPLLCVMTGPLTGTGAPGSGCHSFLWREKNRGGLVFTEGRLGSAMRYAGLDYMVIHGRADKPVWLDVSGGSVEICDEDGLDNMDSTQMTELLLSRSDCDDSSALALGKDGVLIEDYRFELKNPDIARTLETMNLRAVAAGGIAGIPINRPKEFLSECLELYKHKPVSQPELVRYGEGAHTGHYLSPWRGVGAQAPESGMDDADGFALKLAGLYWDEAFPLPDADSCAARLLSCVLPGKWDAPKLADAAKQVRVKAAELTGQPLGEGGGV